MGMTTIGPADKIIISWSSSSASTLTLKGASSISYTLRSGASQTLSLSGKKHIDFTFANGDIIRVILPTEESHDSAKIVIAPSTLSLGL